MPALISLAVFAFVLYCVLDVVLTEASSVRNLPKPLWLLVTIFVPILGGIAWLLGGRPEHTGRSPGGGGRPARPGTGPPSRGTPRHGQGRPTPRTPPKGPDDDPDFLKRVDDRLRRGDQDGPQDDA